MCFGLSVRQMFVRLFDSADGIARLTATTPTNGAVLCGLLVAAVASSLAITLVMTIGRLWPIALVATTFSAMLGGWPVSLVARSTNAHRGLVITIGGFGCGAIIPLLVAIAVLFQPVAIGSANVLAVLAMTIVPGLLGVAAAWTAVAVGVYLSAQHTDLRRTRRRRIGLLIVLSYLLAAAITAHLIDTDEIRIAPSSATR